MPIQLTIAFEKVLLAEMERERSLLSDDTLGQTVSRRILAGAAAVEDGLSDHIDWRPISTRAEQVSLAIDPEVAEALQAVCVATEYTADVVVAAFLGSDLCTPPEVVATESGYRTLSRPVDRGPLRREPGKGNIYRAYFEIPGYQLAFISMLGSGSMSQSAVLGEALLALARQVRVTRRVGPVPISYEARDLADRMISIAAANAARPWGSRRRYSAHAPA